jgi:hypothetical protein
MGFSCLSLRQLLEQHLFSVAQAISNPELCLRELNAHALPVYLLKHTPDIVYRSAIAFWLAERASISQETGQEGRGFNRFLPSITSAIAAQLEQLSNSLNSTTASSQPSLVFRLQIHEPGWFNFHLSEPSLALWLHHFPQMFLPEKPQHPIEEGISSDDLLPYQYAHARCCSVLRLAHQAKMIQLRDRDFHQRIWQWREPEALAWFSPWQQFLLAHPSEMHLIREILAAVDGLANPTSTHWLRLTANLSQAFLECDRYCRIWGETYLHNPDLSLVRLRLMAMTQWLLQTLLQAKLDASAPAAF